jgi:orotate phosphoribosyltransferase
MRPEGLLTIGRLALTHFAKAHWEPDAVGGLTLGADPVAYAISCASASSAIPIRAFTVRKEPKAHGTQRLIEGPLREGDKVVVVEDVLTTGASTLQAIEAVQAFGAGLLGVLAVVDREEGGAARLRDAGYDVRRLTTVSDILALNS